MLLTDTSARYVVYRNILLVLIRGGILLVAGLAILLSMILYATHVPTGAATRSMVAAAIAVLISLALIWLAIRIVGSRISAGPDGVFVHTVLRRCRFVPWPDITGFTLMPAPRFNNSFTRSAVAVAVMRRHNEPIYCLGASFAEPSAAADSMLSALQSQHRTWLAGQPAP